MTTPGSNSPVLRSRNGTENPPDRFDEKIFCRTSQILLIDWSWDSEVESSSPEPITTPHLRVASCTASHVPSNCKVLWRGLVFLLHVEDCKEFTHAWDFWLVGNNCFVPHYFLPSCSFMPMFPSELKYLLNCSISPSHKSINNQRLVIFHELRGFVARLSRRPRHLAFVFPWSASNEPAVILPLNPRDARSRELGTARFATCNKNFRRFLAQVSDY